MPTVDGRLHFFVTSHHEWNYRMFSSKISFNSTLRQTVFERKLWFSMMEKGFFPKHWSRHQKNWIPFIYKGKTMIVQSFNPLHVMELVEEGSAPFLGEPGCGLPSRWLPEKIESKAYSKTFSMGSLLDLGWEYGELRGGTPAVLLPGEKHFFAFFHTRHHLPGNMLETYFMGAVTWCANSSSSSFHLYSMSKSPIVNISMYEGSWTPNQRGPSRIDYVVFPLGLILNRDNKSVTISFGHQDREGFIAKIDLHSLLQTMKIVGAPC